MTISELKNHLATASKLAFKLPNGNFVPEHFHVTEIALVAKHFVDCGGTERFEKSVTMQLWHSTDTDHRLQGSRLLEIIAMSEKKLGIGDFEIEVEYQSDTIGKYSLGVSNQNFELLAKQTNCLAQDLCGIEPIDSNKNQLDHQPQTNCCPPNGGCC